MRGKIYFQQKENKTYLTEKERERERPRTSHLKSRHLSRDLNTDNELPEGIPRKLRHKEQSMQRAWGRRHLCATALPPG